jgi:hypothetical protein
MKKQIYSLLLVSIIMALQISCGKDDPEPEQEQPSGDVTVVFGDGGTKATAITDLVVDGVTYDVQIRTAVPNEIYGTYPGTYTFTTNAEAVTAVEAINNALNEAGASHVGHAGQAVDEDRYRIGYESFEVGAIENCRFKLGIRESSSWKEGFEETNPYNDEPVLWAVFTTK